MVSVLARAAHVMLVAVALADAFSIPAGQGHRAHARRGHCCTMMAPPSSAGSSKLTKLPDLYVICDDAFDRAVRSTPPIYTSHTLR